MSDHLDGKRNSARKTRWLLSATVALTVVGLFSLGAPAAKADTWSFSLTDSTNTTNINFSLPTGVPISNWGGTGVVWTLNGVVQDAAALWFSDAASGGGFSLGNSGEILNLFGPALYSGPESGWDFIEGTYFLTSLGSGEQFNSDFTLTLVDPPDGVPAPEPSNIQLLGMGLFGIIGLAYTKRSTRTALVKA